MWRPKRRDPVDLRVVEAVVLEARRSYRCGITFDPYQAEGMAQRLRGMGVHCQEFVFSASSVGRLALPLFQSIRERRIALFDDRDDGGDLLDELANVTIRQSSPGVWRLDHPRNGHDDQAIAIALAMSGLLKQPSVGSQTKMNDLRLVGRR